MGSKILIVDDMPDAIEFLPEWLQREGYETSMASRGQQALALAEEQHPDLMLLDVMMPGMDGIETCRRLRMNPATAHIPVILVSARSPSEARAEGLLAGATDYITKPIHFPDLLERVQRILSDKTGEDHFDHRRLLEEMAYTALTVLPCNLTWLLIVDSDNRWMDHQSIAMDRGAEAAQYLLKLLRSADDEEVRFPLVPGNNPLAEVILSRTVLINIPVNHFQSLPGGGPFHRAFSQFRFTYVSLLPLVTSGRSVGVMVLATIDSRVAETRRTQQILNSLSSQAAMVVDNARLMANLTAREGQMRAEQEFRQMVLDTMGEGLIVVDEQAKITYVNNQLLRMTNYTRDTLYGQSAGLLFHPSQRQRVVQSLMSERGSTLPFSQQLYTRAGVSVPVLMSRVTSRDHDGENFNTVIVVTDLSELHKQEEAVHIQTLRLQAINRAANAISSASTFDEVVNISLESALEVVRGQSASLLLHDSDRSEMLRVVGTIGTAPNRNKQVAFGESLVGWVASNAKSQLLLQANDKMLPEYGPRVQSVIAVPLIAADQLVGVLEVIDQHNGVFDTQDLETLESLAGSTAVAIENARLFDDQRRRVTELSTLLDASAAVSSTLDFGDILERIARRLSLALQVERVLIADWQRLSNQLETVAEVVNTHWTLGHGPAFHLNQLPLTGAIFESKAPIIADNNRIELNPSGLQAVAGFPILSDDRVIGVVILYSELPETPLSQSHADSVSDVVQWWLEGISRQEDQNWQSRSNLTDLCQRVLQASGVRWCSVAYLEQATREVRLLREIGRALWLERPGKRWDPTTYPSLIHVLTTGEPLTLQVDHLEHDPGERVYLRSVGGSTCLISPLFIRGESNGLVKLIDTKREPRFFDTAELSLCQGIANVVGNAMENAQLYAEQERRASALEAAYKELQEADRLKDDLLQNLSHELRTPLTHILGYIRLLGDEAFGPLTGDQSEAVNLVLNKAQHLADLVKDIVAVQESELHNLMPKPIHLERVIALAIRSISGQAQSRDIHITARVPTNLPLVYADPVRIGEVFEELLENAIKFSPNGTEIEVTLEDPGGPMLHTCVRDYGIGIHPDEHEKIFRRFYQVESGTTRRFAGTGLGLSIVRQVVEGHNGRVWVESQPGEGSTFHLTLPKIANGEQNG